MAWKKTILLLYVLFILRFIRIDAGGNLPSVSAVDSEPYTIGQTYSFTCLPSDVDQLLVASYEWVQDGVVLTSMTTQTIQLEITATMHTLVCSEMDMVGMLIVGGTDFEITAQIYVPPPSITVRNRPANDIYDVGYSYTFVCDSELADMVTGYNWYKDGEIESDTDINYHQVQAMSTTHMYSCTVNVTTIESDHSPNITVFAPSIESVQVENRGQALSELKPLYDSTLNLTCVSETKELITDDVNYEWFENDVLVGTAQQITILAYIGYSELVKCRATVGDDVMESNPVSITSQELPPRPFLSLSSVDSVTRTVFPNGAYTLHCLTSSLSLNSTIVWLKENVQIKCTSHTSLYITRYNPLHHNGDYNCQIIVLDKTVVSNTLTLVASEPGKPCLFKLDCPSQTEAYTGSCDGQRCVCSDGYRARWNICA